VPRKAPIFGKYSPDMPVISVVIKVLTGARRENFVLGSQ
jgi:hypothetical protein